MRAAEPGVRRGRLDARLHARDVRQETHRERHHPRQVRAHGPHDRAGAGAAGPGGDADGAGAEERREGERADRRDDGDAEDCVHAVLGEVCARGAAGDGWVGLCAGWEGRPVCALSVLGGDAVANSYRIEAISRDVRVMAVGEFSVSFRGMLLTF